MDREKRIDLAVLHSPSSFTLLLTAEKIPIRTQRQASLWQMVERCVQCFLPSDAPQTLQCPGEKRTPRGNIQGGIQSLSNLELETEAKD